ncbi:MAG: phenylalanine--tRNA ligase subunit alpha [candidate division WOR-3 bacterium]
MSQIGLPGHEFRLFGLLAEGKRGVFQAAGELNLDQSLVMAAALSLQKRGWVAIAEEQEEVFTITEAGRKIMAEGWPEVLALRRIKEQGGRVALQKLPGLLGKDDVRAEVKWLLRRGWCRREGEELVVTPEGEEEKGTEDIRFIGELAGFAGQWVSAERLQANLVQALALLKGRGELFKRKQQVKRILALTDEGQRVWNSGGVSELVEVTQLTPELLVSGRWRTARFKSYDVTLEAIRRYPGKAHPLQRIIQEVRRAFLEMGFEEVVSPVVETSFWDFDALFQPQDHPAREMQATFYLAIPAEGRLPDEELVKRVAETHENGGRTGSTGWRYHWDIEKARRLVLRTHTTATTVRALAQNPKPPRKVFCVGKTFRRENIDQTHLPEFYQIDGIIIDEQASLATLFGTLAEFYRKMGASDVRFRPSYFPYTEPSAEVFCRLGNLGWVEMGGSGVFRPEVTEPLGCRTRVLAWGLGLERLAMLRFGLDDIRKLYWADINWLREAQLCR